MWDVAMNLMLFSNISRFDTAPRKYAEAQLAFLDRSARAEEERVRGVLEAWFARYPDQHKSEMVSRFRANEDSAFFELYLHELLRRLGYEVEVHPVSPSGASTHPEFLAKKQPGQSLYMEAALVTGVSRLERGAESRMNAVYDKINTIKSTDFFIGMNVKGAPDTSPPARKIKDKLENWLQNHDWKQVNDDYELRGDGELPRLPFAHGRWRIEFFLIPKKADVRGNPDIRPIGMQVLGLHAVDISPSIRQTIMDKAGHYGKFEDPYLIALNVLPWPPDPGAVARALFGMEQYLDVPVGALPEYQRVRRKGLDGAWIGTCGPRNTGVSGVLVVHALNPWNIPMRGITLYHSPWARKPCDGPLTRLCEWIPSYSYRWNRGVDPRELFNLRGDWPE